MNPLNKPPPQPKINYWEERTRKRKEAMEAEKLNSQASSSTQVPAGNNISKPQPNKPQPNKPKPQTQPESSSSKPTQASPFSTPSDNSKIPKPPTQTTQNFIPDLIKIFRGKSQCIVVGDFNAKHKAWNPRGNGNKAGTALHNYARSSGNIISAPSDFTRIPNQTNYNASIIDLGLSCGLNNITAESHYELSSDHNPVHFVINFNSHSSHLHNCKIITNWNKYQDILSSTIAGNPTINNEEDIEDAINSLNYNIHSAINNSSKFKSMKQDFTLVPYPTRIKIREKNRLRKLWQHTRYPPLKTELNRLQREIKRDLSYIKQREWDDALVECNHSDNSLHKLIARANKKPVTYPPLLGFQGL
ncbi:putative RNA-directed DNA polymerase from transposon X-element, partial [Trichonephila clavata]